LLADDVPDMTNFMQIRENSKSGNKIHSKKNKRLFFICLSKINFYIQETILKKSRNNFT